MTTRAEYQANKNQRAVQALKALAQGIQRGELEVDFVFLNQGMEQGNWMFRCALKETEKYGKSKQLSAVSD